MGDGYRTGRKIIPKDLAVDLNPQSFAIWIMDDGCYTNGIIDISTYSFTLSEIEFLESIILNKFGIYMKHHKDGNRGFRMYANKSETLKIIKLVKSYIVYPMEYKVGCVAP